MKTVFLILVMMCLPALGTEWLQSHGIYVYPKAEPDQMAQLYGTDILVYRYRYGVEASYHSVRLTCLFGKRWDILRGEPDSGIQVDVVLFRYIKKF